MARTTRVTLLGLVVLYAVLVVWAAMVLPDRVPSHWSGGSGPDDYGSRTETIIMFVVLGAVLPGLFGLLGLLIPRSRRLVGLNVPNRDYWLREENLPRARHMAAVDLGVLACLSAAFCCAFPPAIVSASRDSENALPVWFFVAVVAYPIAVLGYAGWMVIGRWRRPQEGSSLRA